MVKRLFVLAAMLATALPAQAQSTGDLLFTAFNADEDGFAMVTLVDLPVGAKVWFSDNEWDGVSAFNGGARRLYERLGYQVVGELTDFLATGQRPDPKAAPTYVRLEVFPKSARVLKLSPIGSSDGIAAQQAHKEPADQLTCRFAQAIAKRCRTAADDGQTQ